MQPHIQSAISILLPIRTSSIVIIVAILLGITPLPAALKWLPVTEEDRAATTSSIDPEAGAEILYRVQQIDASHQGTTESEEYIRFKVYNEKGVQKLDKIDIIYNDSLESIDFIDARVIKPDGTVINIDSKTIFDRNIIKAGDIRGKIRSFSFPALEPGVIAEYKYRKVGYYSTFTLKFRFMQPLPTRHVIFRVRPFPLYYGWYTEGYFVRCAEQKLQQSKDEFNYIEMRNLPALEEEPWMPVEDDRQPWMVFYPRDEKMKNADVFWKEHGRELAIGIEKHAKKPSKLVQTTSDSIAPKNHTESERLSMINNYCRSHVLNLDYYTPGGGIDEKVRLKQNRSPDELINNGIGRSDEIQILFIALARANGIDARAAMCSSRENGTFFRSLLYPSYLSDPLVAVKQNDKWCFFDPANRLVTTGELHWTNESMPAMIIMPKTIEWVVTPHTPASQSTEKRKATLQLDEEGTLTGEIRIEYTGQKAIVARKTYQLKSKETLEEIIRKDIQERIPLAEVTDIKVPNANQYLKPLFVTYNIKVPGYADRTGQRLFVQPNFFAKGTSAPFSAPKRIHDICIDYPLGENDDISITLPKNYAIEEGNAPDSIGEANWGKYIASIGLRRSTNTILYKRQFEFSPIRIPATQYELVKRVFDIIHKEDSHILIFKATAE